MSFARKFGDKYHTNLIDTTTKTGIDAVKTASRRVVQKTAGSTDLIGNKIADKTTSVGKTKSKEKEDKTEIYIPSEKGSKLFSIRNSLWQLANAEAFAKAYLSFLVSTLAKKMPMQLDDGDVFHRNFKLDFMMQTSYCIIHIILCSVFILLLFSFISF